MYESVMIECGAVQKAILACRKILQSIAINCKFKTFALIQTRTKLSKICISNQPPDTPTGQLNSCGCPRRPSWPAEASASRSAYHAIHIIHHQWTGRLGENQIPGLDN